MAKNDAKGKAKAAFKKQPKPKKRGSGKLSFFFIAFAAGLSLLFIMPTFILVLVGMAPTYVAIFADNDPEKSSTAAVGAMNCAGVVPFVIDLWMKGQDMQNVMHILSQGTTWLVMLGAAGIGHLIIFAVPQATATMTLIRAESRLKILKKNLETLRETWGSDVGTTKPIERVINRD
jgi:hypothetical protein